MANFFSNFDVVIAKPKEFSDPTADILAKEDGLGGYVLQVNRGSDYFKDIFGEQRVFTKHERQQITLFAIGAFLKRDTLAREKFLPGTDAGGVVAAIAGLAEGGVERGAVGAVIVAVGHLANVRFWHRVFTPPHVSDDAENQETSPPDKTKTTYSVRGLDCQ